jgi:outer membrane protein
MKRIWLLILVAMLPALPAHAELKIGYVNAARLLEEAPQAEAATQRLKKEFQPREDNLVSLKKELAQLDDQMRRNADVVSESERSKMDRDLREKQRDLRRLQDEFRDDLNFRRNEEIGKLQQLIKQIIEAAAKDEQYDLVLFDGIAFASPKIDLTDRILERLRMEMAKAAAGRPGK